MQPPNERDEERTAEARALLVALLARLAAGDRGALAQVYRLTSARLHALLRRMLRDPLAAEEVLQDVYLAVWRRGITFDPQLASPITWLVTIARNKAIDRLRSERAKGRGGSLMQEVDVPDPSPSVVERLEYTERNARLHSCLDGLTREQGAAIRAAFFDGLTYEALAAREGVPVGTMKSRIRRGLSRLRACLDG